LEVYTTAKKKKKPKPLTKPTHIWDWQHNPSVLARGKRIHQKEKCLEGENGKKEDEVVLLQRTGEALPGANSNNPVKRKGIILPLIVKKRIDNP